LIYALARRHPEGSRIYRRAEGSPAAPTPRGSHNKGDPSAREEKRGLSG
jgi:hypothetical protein